MTALLNATLGWDDSNYGMISESSFECDEMDETGDQCQYGAKMAATVSAKLLRNCDTSSCKPAPAAYMGPCAAAKSHSLVAIQWNPPRIGIRQPVVATRVKLHDGFPL